ncbi:MAG: replicative DNA helicase [Gemmatimonadetes bacterium]|nr:replicative DNA helicase [Gemmatimonadota bacterium]
MSELRVPPQAIEAEASVLGAALIDPTALERVADVFGSAGDTAFYRSQNQTIFDQMKVLASRGEPIDLLTVSEELEKCSKLKDVGGLEYLTSLAEGVVSAANVEYHAEILRDKAVLRALIRVTGNYATAAYDASEAADEIVDQAQAAIFELAQTRSSAQAVPIREVLGETIRKLEELGANPRAVTGLASGFKDLDLKTAGFQKGDLIILAARPSMGKTSLALNVAQHVAIELEEPVAVFSLEMSKESLVQRLLASEARVNSTRMRRGDLDQEDWSRILTAVDFLDRAPIFIDDTSALTPLELRARCRSLKARHGLSMVLVDYLQLMSGPSKMENRQQEISFISRSIKALAKELDLPILALSQLSRAVESRGGDKRPQLSDLRESGAIEQDADVVCFIHRPEMYSPEVREIEGQAEVIIGKQRNGPTGRIQLSFVKDYTRFEDYAPEESVPEY